MILLLAVLAGVFAGWARARAGGRRYQPASLSYMWLVIVSMLPQVLVIYIPPIREFVPDWAVKFLLIGSQAGLLIFVWLNRKSPGLWILGTGLILNLLVMGINGGGLMPISPVTVAQLTPDYPSKVWQAGDRFGWSKDIILPRSSTRLWWLSDCFLSPAWLPYRVAFSLGDVLIALGVFWFLWVQGNPKINSTREAYGHECDESIEQKIVTTGNEGCNEWSHDGMLNDRRAR
jgi:hypothetical protein